MTESLFNFAKLFSCEMLFQFTSILITVLSTVTCETVLIKECKYRMIGGKNVCAGTCPGSDDCCIEAPAERINEPECLCRSKWSYEGRFCAQKPEVGCDWYYDTSLPAPGLGCHGQGCIYLNAMTCCKINGELCECSDRQPMMELVSCPDPPGFVILFIGFTIIIY